MNSKTGSERELWGAIEGGGTKFNCAVLAGPEEILSETRIGTEDPESTVAAVCAFFEAAAERAGHPLSAIGIGSFGPVVVSDSAGERYGTITTTPKPGWKNFPLRTRIRDGLGGQIPVRVDTDTNASLLGEWHWGAGQGARDLIYITVGTGIGGAAMVDGNLVHGRNHPEMGHLRVPHDRGIDPYEGRCPFHGDCLEGLASGPAVQDRWGMPAEEIPPDHEAWNIEAGYLAAALWNITLVTSPEKIILGGGVMEQGHLLELIRMRFVELRNDYGDLNVEPTEYLVAPGLGSRSGILGAYALAVGAATGERR